MRRSRSRYEVITLRYDYECHEKCLASISTPRICPKWSKSGNRILDRAYWRDCVPLVSASNESHSSAESTKPGATLLYPCLAFEAYTTSLKDLYEQKAEEWYCLIRARAESIVH